MEAEYEIEFKSQEGLEPERAYEGDAGWDLKSNSDVVIPFGTTVVVNTSVELRFPKTVYGQVCSRSGLAANESLSVLNAPGILDPGYENEIKVILHNHTSCDYHVKKGRAVAQLVFQEVVPVKMKKVEEFTVPESPKVTDSDPRTRGGKGLGSSDTNKGV